MSNWQDCCEQRGEQRTDLNRHCKWTNEHFCYSHRNWNWTPWSQQAMGLTTKGTFDIYLTYALCGSVICSDCVWVIGVDIFTWQYSTDLNNLYILYMIDSLYEEIPSEVVPDDAFSRKGTPVVSSNIQNSCTFSFNLVNLIGLWKWLYSYYQMPLYCCSNQ